MAAPAQFNRRMRRVARQIQENATAATRQAALGILQQVVVATPVDTGRARSNWNVNFGAPDRTVRDRASDKTGQGAIQRGTQKLLTRETGETTIFVSNNLPYIRRLNEGSSAQAPAGFVEQAIVAGRAAAARVRIVGFTRR